MFNAAPYSHAKTALSGEKANRAVRILTVSPVMAALLVTLLRLNRPDAYQSAGRYLLTLLGLSVLPLMAYPVARIVPALHKQGRHGARRLAIILSVAGYLVSLAPALAAGGTRMEKTVALTYLMSGVLMALTNFVFRFRASGHTCGVAGPIAALCLFVSPWYLLMLPLLLQVIYSSLRLGRHTLPQLLAGAACSVVPLAVFASLL